jgi:putative DNA primase/helicase
MICVEDQFYTVEGRVTDEAKIRQTIYQELRSHCQTGLSKRISNLLELLKLEANAPPLPLHKDRLHVANGTLFLSGRFSPQKEYCANRLAVAYRPDAGVPNRWLCFLDQLLYPEDIPTLQEYMGYCFLPTTKAQKMLFLTGKGGEGKSRIGLVMRSLLGQNMNVGSIAKVELSPFARADLEHQLLMVDDDLKLEALPQTNNIKSIVTAEMPMDLERKGRQSYQGLLYARFLAFGNGTMKSLYDRSDGFYRRQLILTVRERDPKRKDDPFLSEKLRRESEGIFLWCLDGLQRLIANDYRFTISPRSRANMTEAVRDGNNAVEFMESTGYIELHADREITSRELYSIYERWCMDNVYKPLSPRSFSTFLVHNERTYNLEHTNTVRNAEGKRVRGFVGICAAT